MPLRRRFKSTSTYREGREGKESSEQFVDGLDELDTEYGGSAVSGRVDGVGVGNDEHEGDSCASVDSIFIPDVSTDPDEQAIV